MKGKLPDQQQKNLFRPILIEIINPKHELVALSEELDWQTFEKEFGPLYSTTGQPGVPIRIMVGLLILKQIYDLGDETVMDQWVQNPYFQYFCGESEFQWKAPCDPSDLVHFRKRISVQGVELIFKLSVQVRKDDINTTDLLIDTTAQEKNITYPTDAKLLTKVIELCNSIAKKEKIKQRQNYKTILKQLQIKQRFAHHPKRKKEAKAALRKLRTIAGRLVRELERKLDKAKLEAYATQIENCKKVVSQKKDDKNKIYSLHEPDTACIAKGKAHKKFEFGSKVSIAVIPKTNVIVAVKNFNGNPHDSTTLEPTIQHAENITGLKFKNAIVDRGYKGKKKIGETIVISPDSPKAKSHYSNKTMRKKCRSRAAIEPVIGHVKQDCRMIRNYLKGKVGNDINAILAAAAFNFRGFLRKIKIELFLSYFFAFLFSQKRPQINFLGCKISS